MSGAERMDSILIKNASQNNLKNINVDIPLNKFTCVTGVSGCGKSSLVYDTLYAESQRNFFESMSANMYGQKLMDKPKVDSIENLRPALNISQNYYNHNPRSTIGTFSDISQYLRTIFALIINQQEKKQLKDSFFSPNTSESCCEHCKGLGEEYAVSLSKLVPDESKALKKGAILYYKGKDSSLEMKMLEYICNELNIDINKRYSELSQKEVDQLIYRKDVIKGTIRYKSNKGRYKQTEFKMRGVLVELNEKLLDIDTPSSFASLAKYLVKQQCSYCKGKRLNEQVLKYKISGLNIAEVESLSLIDLEIWFRNIKVEYSHMDYYNQVLHLIEQIELRVKKMIELDVGYLSLDRSIPTLSGGELQRVRIAKQLNCSLSGLIYILDEPSKGLHYRNITNIIKATKELVDKGNTVIAIEHNKQYIAAADMLIELGPVGGPNGGYLMGQHMASNKVLYNIKYKELVDEAKTKYMKFKNIKFRNIKGVDASIPIGKVSCITGVSGSGKSSFVKVIEECISKNSSVYCESYASPVKIKKVYLVDQQPIGKTQRSTVVSYLEIYDKIRELLAETKEAIDSGLSASDFSMNVVGGRCECCQGTGVQKIELNYLPDSYIKCPECNGQRFQKNTLNVRYRGKNINDILDEPIENIIKIFEDNDKIYNKLSCMLEMGLGYISLGQMSMNLSGGEAKRIKLAKVLGNRVRGKNVYILDEPTSGLNSKDIVKIEAIINKLVNQGETIIIVEHNIEFIVEVADYMIDFGTEAGNAGGVIVGQGSPTKVMNLKKSSWSCIGDINNYA